MFLFAPVHWDAVIRYLFILVLFNFCSLTFIFVYWNSKHSYSTYRKKYSGVQVKCGEKCEIYCQNVALSSEITFVGSNKTDKKIISCVSVVYYVLKKLTKHIKIDSLLLTM